MNLALKHALIDRQVPFYKSAQDSDVHYSKLSKIIYGLVNPTEEEKERLAAILGKPKEKLFSTGRENKLTGEGS